jgi:hypothetical protein
MQEVRYYVAFRVNKARRGRYNADRHPVGRGCAR